MGATTLVPPDAGVLAVDVDIVARPRISAAAEVAEPAEDRWRRRGRGDRRMPQCRGRPRAPRRIRWCSSTGRRAAALVPHGLDRRALVASSPVNPHPRA